MRQLNARILVLSLSLLLLLTLLVTPPAVAQTEEAPAEPSKAMRIAKGRTSFHLFCQSCHGPSAHGDGPVAEFLKIPPANLTLISARNGGEFPIDKMAEWIDGRDPVKGHGSRDMPIWGDAFKETEETDDESVVREKILGLAYYLKSLQMQEGAAEAAD